MSWGSAFGNAWNKASDRARQGVSLLAAGERWLGNEVAKTYEWSKGQAGRAVDWTKQQAAKMVDAAKSSVRAKIQGKVDFVFDGIGKDGELVRETSNTVKNAFGKVRSLFGTTKSGAPAVACPLPPKGGLSDLQADGWFMSPTNDGQCALTPPCAGAVQAREKAEVSPCCKAQRAAGMAPRDIVYVNGIQNSQQEACATLHAIAEQTCARVIGVYNASAGKGKVGFMKDSAQTAQDRNLIKAAGEGKVAPTLDGRNPAVDTLFKTIYEDLKNKNAPEIWAHSQGGAVTSLALYDAKNTLAAETGSPDPLAGVKIKSMGSAAPQWPDGPEYEHYIHVNDFTPTSLGLGPDATKVATKKAGNGAKVIRFSGDATSGFNDESPKKDWFPANTANHGMEAVYIEMEKQKHGGCPCGKNAPSSSEAIC